MVSVWIDLHVSVVESHVSHIHVVTEEVFEVPCVLFICEAS